MHGGENLQLLTIISYHGATDFVITPIALIRRDPRAS